MTHFGSFELKSGGFSFQKYGVSVPLPHIITILGGWVSNVITDILTGIYFNSLTGKMSNKWFLFNTIVRMETVDGSFQVVNNIS